MELSTEQQIEYDKLFKELVAQGGPTKGQLKAAGHKDPDGVARLVELGWINPKYVFEHRTEMNIETGRETDVRIRIKPGDATKEVLEDAVEELNELALAEKEAEDAQLAAEAAIVMAKEKADVAESKKPPPCSRCGGDGLWHSLKTGYRAKTSSTPLIDPSRSCPKCN